MRMGEKHRADIFLNLAKTKSIDPRSSMNLRHKKHEENIKAHHVIKRKTLKAARERSYKK